MKLWLNGQLVVNNEACRQNIIVAITMPGIEEWENRVKFNSSSVFTEPARMVPITAPISDEVHKARSCSMLKLARPGYSCEVIPAEPNGGKFNRNGTTRPDLVSEATKLLKGAGEAALPRSKCETAGV